MNPQRARSDPASLSDLLIRHSVDAILLAAPDGRIFAANPAACALFGYTEAEIAEGGRSLLIDVGDPEVAGLMASRRENGFVRGEQWMRCKGGRRIRVEVTSALFEAEGEQRSVVIVRDLSQQDHQRYLERFVEVAAADLPLILCVAEEDWRLLWLNPAMERITGYPRAELIGHQAPLRHYLATNHPEKLAEIDRAVQQEGAWHGELFARRRSGEIYPLQGSITAIDSPQNGPRHLVGTFADISAMQDYRERLHQASLYDPVTGLPNRTLFERQAREVLERAVAEAYWLLLIDINAFRTVNEAHGYETGDRVLEQLATRLADGPTEAVVMARSTGDSFVVLMPDRGGFPAITATVSQIKHRLHEPLQADGGRFALTTSIGISRYPDDGRTPDALMQSAESALNWAKRYGADSYAFYEPGSEGDSRRFIALAAPMREGIARGEFIAYFQPIVDSVTRQVMSMETLARWRRDDGTVVSPGDFIPVAERTGMIDAITDTLLRQACRYLHRLDRTGNPGLTYSINLSARQFHDPQLPQRLLQVLREERASPDRIVLEITESVLMDDPETKSALLQTLQAEGMQVVIDDFGTGYSSFAYLKHFQVDGIKLDRFFVKDVPGRPRDEALIRMMLAVGNELGIPVVAEGVETDEQADFIRENGCSRIQGYLIAPPMPGPVLAEHLGYGTM